MTDVYRDPKTVETAQHGWVVDGHGYNRDSYTMEVVFTRKVKPVAIGTVIICMRPSSPLQLAERQEDGWHNIYPASDDILWGGSLEEQDELARRCWRPITDAAWEED